MIATVTVTAKVLLILAVVAFVLGAVFAAAPKTRNSVFYIACGLAAVAAAFVAVRL